LHLRPFMMHLPLWRRLLGGYLCADLSYVLFTRRYPHAQPVNNASTVSKVGNKNATKNIANNADSMPTNGHFSSQNGIQSTAELMQLRQAQQAYLLGNCLVNWFSWVVPSVMGVLLANLIPQRWGLGFAGILALVGIACSLASSKLRIVSAVIAGAAGVVAFALPLRLNILVAIAVAVMICLSLERLRQQGARVERGAS
jgi:predicted branched-subunit amino acid permease